MMKCWLWNRIFSCREILVQSVAQERFWNLHYTYIIAKLCLFASLRDLAYDPSCLTVITQSLFNEFTSVLRVHHGQDTAWCLRWVALRNFKVVQASHSSFTSLNDRQSIDNKVYAIVLCCSKVLSMAHYSESSHICGTVRIVLLQEFGRIIIKGSHWFDRQQVSIFDLIVCEFRGFPIWLFI